MKRSNLLGLIFVVAALAGGCGQSTTNVKGVVKLDGKPVEGATVAFVSEDGKTTYTGLTDGNGNFSLVSATNKNGVASGNYKVTVVKRPSLGGGAMDPSSPDAMKAMQKTSNEGANSGPPSKFKMPGGMKMPGMPSGGGGIKSELPAIYASSATTPITVKVPPDKQPVEIELKSAP